ncbi:PKS-NRPS hybrid synthetase [Frankliniella fusca]|uniref:PKS-NRPS hybrid synthetase n=1 Tax=Frankliniella fusca TaxID=407009 RepID=A0AAE1L588_9NEOP|nr:PKS-NRPS hybrid synthetase [Frankliniella fusca]
MVAKLKDVIDEYNLKCSSQCADIWVDNDDIVVVVCSPLMKRVPQLLNSSSGMVIMDFSGNMDRYDTMAGFLTAPSLAGGLPLGLIMTSAETEALITKGLMMLQKLYPNTSFFGRGTHGPKVFITDDCKKERNSLASLYPLSVLLSCLFHILQAFLRYVTATEHRVKKEDKAVIYDAFRNLVRSQTEEEYNNKYEDFKTSDVLLRNKTIYTHVTKDLHPCRIEWALCYRSDLVVRGNNTSNLAEGNFLQVKSTVMERVKAFNAVQLFDFFVTKLEAYYQA